tara:strand:+ start:247 stop:450 length:204 start_codon:yes stop_codon:yes gene_type:complete
VFRTREFKIVERDGIEREENGDGIERDGIERDGIERKENGDGIEGIEREENGDKIRRKEKQKEEKLF